VGINCSYQGLLNTTKLRWRSDFPSQLNHTPITKVSHLPSGLRVASGVSSGDIATVGIWFNVGSAREDDTNSGINNFLHKLILKGGSRDNLDSDIESLGATLTGYSDRETTSFYGQINKNDTKHFVKILAEALQSNKLRNEDIETIRERIINIHRSNRDRWDAEILSDHAHASAYQGTAHASAVIGEPDVTKQVNSDNLLNWKNQFYSQNNIVLVGTGAVKHEELESLASAFNNLPKTVIKPFDRVGYVGSEIRIRDDTKHICKLTYAWEAVGRSDPNYWPFLLLQAFVGQWKKDSISGPFSSSRWAENASQYNLVSTYHSTYKAYNATGLFQIYAECEPGNQLDDTTYYMFNEFQKLATYITPEELFRAKNHLKRKFLSELANPKNLAEWLGETVQASYRAISPAEVFQRIDELTAEDVQKVLADFFTDVDPVLIAHGPIEDFPDYNIVRGWTSWHRW